MRNSESELYKKIMNEKSSHFVFDFVHLKSSINSKFDLNYNIFSFFLSIGMMYHIFFFFFFVSLIVNSCTKTFA